MKIDNNVIFNQSVEVKKNLPQRAKLVSSNLNTSNTSKSKIESLKEKIKNGTYNVNPQTLADKILSKSSINLDS